MYGYEVAQELERQNGGSIPMKPGALYPALRSLEKQGLLSSQTELSEEGRARKYYKLTKTGTDTIKHWKKAWEDTKTFVDTILERVFIVRSPCNGRWALDERRCGFGMVC